MQLGGRARTNKPTLPDSGPEFYPWQAVLGQFLLNLSGKMLLPLLVTNPRALTNKLMHPVTVNTSQALQPASVVCLHAKNQARSWPLTKPHLVPGKIPLRLSLPYPSFEGRH